MRKVLNGVDKPQPGRHVGGPRQIGRHKVRQILLRALKGKYYAEETLNLIRSASESQTCSADTG